MRLGVNFLLHAFGFAEEKQIYKLVPLGVSKGGAIGSSPAHSLTNGKILGLPGLQFLPLKNTWVGLQRVF
jgi:hypothetical protein